MTLRRSDARYASVNIKDDPLPPELGERAIRIVSDIGTALSRAALGR